MKKVAPKKRIRFGLKSIKMTHNDYEKFKFDFKQEATPDLVSKLVKDFIKNQFSKDEQRFILANPEYHFSMFTDFGAAIHWNNFSKEFPKRYEGYPERIKEYFFVLIEKGKSILKSKQKTSTAIVRQSPMVLLKAKVNDTVMKDIDDLETQWMNGQDTTLDLYAAFQSHDLKGPAVNQVKTRIEAMKTEYDDAFYSRCEQAVEAYEHLTMPQMKFRIKAIVSMLEDLERIKSATKAVRKTRAKKPVSTDRQVKLLKFKQTDSEYKLASIDPKLIPSAMRLLTFNTKTRVFTEYVTTSLKGFEIKGTTIQNFDPDLSRSTRLRKPDEFLSIALKKTVNQINKEYALLTTKSSSPNGRINVDTILLRVFDK